MPKFLIDANLSSRSVFWQSDEYEHVPDPTWRDAQVWQYAVDKDLIIITKDVDFEHRASADTSARVIRICAGNMRRREFRAFLSQVWPAVLEAIDRPGVRLVRVYSTHLETA